VPSDTTILSRTPQEWLLLVHELPARPSNVRVKTWRRMHNLGAVAVKNSIYVLPNTPAAREDFEWIKTEIEAMRGQATVFVAQAADERTTRELIAAFRRTRQEDFARIRQETQKQAAVARRTGMRADSRQRRRALESLRARFSQACALDYFDAAGRREAEAALQDLERQLSRPSAHAPEVSASSRKGAPSMTGTFRNRTWVTRPRPGVDRMASAWLIRRFIDPRARFHFADGPKKGRAVPFDMYGVEFGHHGNHCTFETLAQRFAVTQPAVRRLGQIVHDVDLKDAHYGAPEAPVVQHMVEGLRQSCSGDQELLERGMAFFEALYRSFSAETPTGKRATPRKRAK
jgi:hypothetical protein